MGRPANVALSTPLVVVLEIGYFKVPSGRGVAGTTLPLDYRPQRPPRFIVQRIFLAKGSLATPERAGFVERICALYPEAERVEAFDTPHNRIDLGESNPLALHRLSKRALVEAARRVQPDVDLALCLEERPVWEALGLESRIGRCNCVL